MKIAVYPGSFDPVTYGHIDIVERSLKLFDKVIIAVMFNPKKNYTFSTEERVEMLAQSLAAYKDKIEIDSFSGLTVEYALSKDATALIRGLRAVSDFEYEYQMALMNRKLDRRVETIFLMTGLRWVFTSSTMIKEASVFGADIRSMVPPCVYKKLKDKYTNTERS